MFNLQIQIPDMGTAIASLRQNPQKTARITTTSPIMATANKGRPITTTKAMISREVIPIHAQTTASRRVVLPAGQVIASRIPLTQGQSKVPANPEAQRQELQRREVHLQEVQRREAPLRAEVVLLRVEAVQNRGLLLRKHPGQDKKGIL